MHRPFFFFCLALLWEINSPEAQGHYRQTHTRSHAKTHTHALTHVRRPFLMYDSFPSLSILSHYFLLFHCCREKTGVNHYRQYRLKMQSPPGVQGHWRPMGGRTSVRTHTCTRSHLTGAACKQCDCRLFAQQPVYLSLSLCLVCALSQYLISLHCVHLYFGLFLFLDSFYIAGFSCYTSISFERNHFPNK